MIVPPGLCWGRNLVEFEDPGSPLPSEHVLVWRKIVRQ